MASVLGRKSNTEEGETMSTDKEFREVGSLESNPTKALIKFHDSDRRLLIEKGKLGNLIKGISMEDSVRVFSWDPSQTVLFGDIQEESAGIAEVTKSGKAIRITVQTPGESPSVYFINKVKAYKVLSGEEWSCPVSVLG